jgi:hypothetical protein
MFRKLTVIISVVAVMRQKDTGALQDEPIAINKRII